MEQFDKLMDALNFAFRQKAIIYSTIDFFKDLINDFSIQKLVASFMVVVEMFSVLIFDNPQTPKGEALDLTGYELVFCDEFDGDELDTDVWFHRAEGERRGGFNADTQVKVEDGNLIISGEYHENGKFGTGWYVGMICLRQKYKQGYYEIRCKCNKGDAFWSAFWIQASHPYDHELSQGGVHGAELDIFESSTKKSLFKSNRGYVTQTIHCNGWDNDPEHIDSRMLGKFKTNTDMYDEYNTYGLKWTEDEYIFYINGVESARSTFGNGVSQEFEDVIVSLEIPDEVPEFDHDYTTSMVVDYVKIYQ